MAGLLTNLTTAPTLAFFGSSPWEMAILAGVVLLLFGNRLPGAAKSLGQSFSAFKKGIKEGEDELNAGSSNTNEKVESHS
ncbi:MAG: twin-arginine translocase TatA/TatE family subunit [Planctomycetaceae bacterium]